LELKSIPVQTPGVRFWTFEQGENIANENADDEARRGSKTQSLRSTVLIEGLVCGSHNTCTPMEARIRVAARLRPLGERETRAGDVEAVYAYPEHRTVSLGRSASEKQFSFDYAFPPSSTNTDVYEACVAPLVTQALAGYNVTIFAYGQVRLTKLAAASCLVE